MKKNALIFCCLIIFISASVFCQAQETDLCCERDIMFAHLEMPAEQEYNSSFMIECLFLDGLDFSRHRFNCPLKLGWISPEGRILSDSIVSEMLKLAGQPWTQEEIKFSKDFKGLDYVFFSELQLNRIDTIRKGYWEEGYAGEPDYNPARAYGDYSIRIRLVNVQFDELVWEGYNNWNGDAEGFTEIPPDKTTPNAIQELARRISPSIDKLIYDYERIPVNCNIEMDREAAPSGEEITIRLTDITDDKGRKARAWQRLVIALEQGEITNATRSHDEEKKWAVLVGEEGVVTLKYKAPPACQKETETITIYNSCYWGAPIRPIHDTDPHKQLNSKTFEVIPSYPVQCQIMPEKEELGEGEEIEILLSNFLDARKKPSGRFNRIVVHASKGEILNGSRCRGGDRYRAFSLEDQPVKVIYKAPEDAGNTTDIITVYNSCEINQEGGETSMTTTQPRDPIMTKELRIKHYLWTGKLSIQYLIEWECNYETTGFKDFESERREEKLDLDLAVDDIEFPGIPVALISSISGTGFLSLNFDTESEEQRKDFYELTSINANASCRATGANLVSLLIQKKPSKDPATTKKRMEELAVSDPMKMLEELKGLTSSDDEGFDIDVVITAGGDCAGNMSYHTIIRSEDDNKDDSWTEEGDLTSSFPMLKLSGKMKINPDGSGSVNASFTAEEEYQGKYPSPRCPPGRIFTRCYLSLVKDRQTE
jgi:hypothetical protein